MYYFYISNNIKYTYYNYLLYLFKRTLYLILQFKSPELLCFNLLFYASVKSVDLEALLNQYGEK